MAKFEILTDLPKSTQAEVARIQAISSGQRLASETAFLTALTPYLTNVIVQTDNSGYITVAEGYTLPTGYTGFKNGAFFRVLGRTGKNLYFGLA